MPRFSGRLPADLAESPLYRRLAARALDPEVIDLTESNATRFGLSYPEAEIRAALAAPEVLRYAPDPFGAPAARAAIAASARLPIDPARVVLTASTSEAYALLFKLWCDPHDRVLVPAPSYPLFEQLAALEGVQAASYALEYEGGRWRVDLDSVEAGLRAGARLFIGVNPNNPTGSCFDAEELRGLRALCVEHDVPLLSDEVFARYGFDRASLPGAAAHDGPLTVVLDGLSKSACLPQLKLGWMQLYGPEALVLPALERLAHVADAYLSVSAPVQAAAARLLELTAPVREELRLRIIENRAALGRAVAQLPAVELLEAEGGWYAVLRLPQLHSDEEWVTELAERHGVITHPGFFYDFARRGFLVIALTLPAARFAEGARRLLEGARALST